MNYPIITLTTDFGTSDHYAGAMRGVILSICPQARLVDISHHIAPYAIAEAAFTISQVWATFPNGTVHVIVVDPGVGSQRRPLLAEAAGHKFVAPDNGVLTLVGDAVMALEVREITNARYFRQPVSATFHGRDIFAPVAAHLANGVTMTEFGDRVDNCVRSAFARPSRNGPLNWTGTVLKADRFGNLITNFEAEAWNWLATEPFSLRVGQGVANRVAPNYAAMPTGELFVIAGSSGYLEISLNQASAAEAIGARSGDVVELRIDR